MKPIRTHLSTCSLPAVLAVISAVFVGCASTGVKNPSGVSVTRMSADEQGFVAGTGIESQDVVVVADKMARAIMGVPQIANARGVPRIVLASVNNDTRFTFTDEILLREIRALMNEKAAGKVLFLARERMAELERERELKQSGQVTSSTDPNVNQFKGADFLLTGELTGMTTRTSAGTSDYVLYTFQLIDPNTTDIIWEGSYRIKKQGLEDAAYR
jgi:PBP1b-binding outer membrane lipoprotein LpoB